MEPELESFSKKGNRNWNRTRFGTWKLVSEPDPIILMGTGTETETVCEEGLVPVLDMVPVLVQKITSKLFFPNQNSKPANTNVTLVYQ